MNKLQIVLALGCMVFGLAACGGGSGSKAGGTGGAGATTKAGGVLAGNVTGGSTGIGGATNPGGASGAGGVGNSAGSTATGGLTAAGGSKTTGIGSGGAGLGGTALGGTTGRGGTTITGGATSAGGTTVTGGATSAGGTTGAGGVSRTGGSGATGGTAGSGGTTVAGATTSAGGTMGGNTGGVGGTATTGGSINTGGAIITGGALPSCTYDAGLTNVEACGYLVASGNTILDTSVTADVTVTAIANILEGSPCSVTDKTQRLSLAAADGRTWDLDLNVTGLPASFIRKGDALGLTVASWHKGVSIGQAPVSQSVVVTRGGKTILITWTGTASAISSRSPQSSSGAPAPVTIAGVNLANDGIICANTGGMCGAWLHRALITVGTSSATVEPRHSVSVGGLQVVLASFADAVDSGFCDGFGELTFAAFAP